MRVHLHVRDKVIAVECGDGSQQARWLGHVGVARYDDNFGKSLGAAKGVQKEGGVICEPTERICDVLEHDQHCFVILNDFAE
ncbi:Hypothetical protein, putative [Bodo saltans]|uniref:Par3/HAL N-terminal domain-containing protein n=1 Tax=Bodo saltans TaxID=75058 RepID=A0A0S4JM94_BODSA|nr:Hypothetical protein, putative [Bodo saltans]|eukprot:CUG91323.1 Hypothetical protein, putative [Bodo saltans]